MKNSLKKELIDLLSGTKGQKDVIIINDFNCQPGEYNYQGKVITELEKQELEKRCNKLVIFTLAKDKITENESLSDKDHLHIEVDSPDTMNTFLKLRQIKK